MTYRIVFKRGNPKDITLHDIVAVDYHAGYLYYSDGSLTYTYHVDEIEYSEKISDSSVYIKEREFAQESE